MQRAVESLSEDGRELQQDTAAAWCELAWMQNSLGKSQAALESATRAVTIYEKHRLDIVSCQELQAALAQLLHAAVKLRNDPEVIKVCRKGRAVFNATPTEGSDLIISTETCGMCTLVSEMAEAYRYLNNYSEAVRMADHAVALSTKLYGELHLNTGLAMVRLLTVALNKIEYEADTKDWGAKERQWQYKDRIKTLLPLSEAALQILKKAYGSEHHVTIIQMARHARCVSLHGGYLEAVPLFQKVVKLLETSKELNLQPAHAHALADQAHNLIGAGDFINAEVAFTTALHIMRLRPEAFPGDQPDLYARNFARRLGGATTGRVVQVSSQFRDTAKPL